MAERSTGYITTNCVCLDEIMGGGIQRGQVTLVYGESNAGKTTLALQCAASASRKDLKTLYLDCGNSFSPDRLAQIASNDLKRVSSHIFVSKLKSFSEQSQLIEDVDRYISKNVGLVVVDPITSLYRLELKNSQLVFSLNRSLNRQLAYLNQAAKVHNVAVLLTSQVHSIIQGKNTKVEPVATRVLKFWSQNILDVKSDTKPSVRRVILEKHLESSRIGACCAVLLGKAGIVNLSLRPL